MIRIGMVGDIGSGKSHIAKLFGYPVFNADAEVGKLYKKSRKCYTRLKKALPYYIKSFPVEKNKLLEAVMDNQKNLKKIINIIHPQVKMRMSDFIKKNKNKKFVVLDIPLLMENKINRKNDINKRLKRRYKGNLGIVKKFRKFQLPVETKRKKSDFIIKNNFKNNNAKKSVKKILNFF